MSHRPFWRTAERWFCLLCFEGKTTIQNCCVCIWLFQSHSEAQRGKHKSFAQFQILASISIKQLLIKSPQLSEMCARDDSERRLPRGPSCFVWVAQSPQIHELSVFFYFRFLILATCTLDAKAPQWLVFCLRNKLITKDIFRSAIDRARRYYQYRHLRFGLSNFSEY